MAGTNWKGNGKWSVKRLWMWVAWAAISVIGFLAIEFTSLFDGDDSTPTLTEVITRWVPGWLVFTGMGALVVWLVWHFIASYHEHDLLGKDDE